MAGDVFQAVVCESALTNLYVSLPPQQEELSSPFTHTHTQFAPNILRWPWTSFMWRGVRFFGGGERAGAQRLRLFPPHPGPNREPDIKDRWSETMKLQARCQLPFETKHSPNPGKTRPVPGIRTNKEELEEERRRGRSGGGFTGRVDNLASV